MKPAVFIAIDGWDLESWRRRIEARLPGRTIVCTDRRGHYGGADAVLDQVHYLLAWKPHQVVVDRLPALRAIFSLGAGVDHILRVQRLPDVPILRIVDADLTSRMREYVVWQVLHHLRRGAHYGRMQAGHAWEPVDQPAAHHVAVGVMGLGVMGRSAADALVRLGFRVRSWTRSPKSVEGVEAFVGTEEIDAFLAGTDILVALLPLTPETAGLIDGTLLAKLRRGGPLGGAVLISAGRGGSQVESDIVAALRDGTLSGASLDVFEGEPLSPESPLWDLENVVITPHVAAVSDPEALSVQIAAQITAFERGEPLRNAVDRRRGY